MNPRQRRGVLLLVLALVVAGAVVVGISVYVADVQAQLGPMQTVLRLTEDVEELDPVSADAVEEVEMPERWVPRWAVTDPDDLAEQVAATDLPAGTFLQDSALRSDPLLAELHEKVALDLDPEAAVGCEIEPGDIVDIHATFGSDGGASTTSLLVEQVLVLRIRDGDPDRCGGEDGVVRVILAVDRLKVAKLTNAKETAVGIHLSQRRASDEADIPAGQRSYTRSGG